MAVLRPVKGKCCLVLDRWEVKRKNKGKEEKKRHQGIANIVVQTRLDDGV